MEVKVLAFEEEPTIEDGHFYQWYEFKKDDCVPEEVREELREHLMDRGGKEFMVRTVDKLYKYDYPSYDSRYTPEQVKEHFLEHAKIVSAPSQHQFIKALIAEAQPVIQELRDMVGRQVKWTELPVTGNCDKSFTCSEKDETTGMVDFRVAKLWVEYEKKDGSFDVQIVTKPPRYRGIVQTQTIGKLIVVSPTDGETRPVSYCSHYENVVFSL